MFEWLNGWFTKTLTINELNEMSKLELEAKGREIGIELDRRLKKHKLVKQLHKKLGHPNA